MQRCQWAAPRCASSGKFPDRLQKSERRATNSHALPRKTEGGETREETGERELSPFGSSHVLSADRQRRQETGSGYRGVELTRIPKRKKKYAERTRGGSEGGRRCEDGSSLPARLRTVPAPRRGGTEVDRQEETREAWKKKCSKLGRVVPQQVRPPSHSSCRR